MKVYVDAWGYVTEKFVNIGNIELCEGILRYKKADYPPMPSFMRKFPSLPSKFQIQSVYHTRAQIAMRTRPPAGKSPGDCAFDRLDYNKSIM